MSPGSAMQVHGSGYRPDIDGLRAVAVMAVVLHHLSARLVPGGFVGVDVFFVISGYLITKIIHKEIREGTFSFARFYERRIRRLFPALFAVLAFVLVAGWFVLLPSDYLATARAAAGTVLFSANIVFWRDLAEGYFAADAKLNPLLHMWSLGVEEQFYLLFPVALLLIHRYMRRWVVLAVAMALIMSLGLSVLLTPIKSVASYFLLPTRAWEMLAGSLLALLALPQPSFRALRETLAWAALCVIVAPTIFYSSATPFPGYAAILPVAGTVALIWLGSGESTAVGRLLSLRPVVYIGLISYSLYLWHWPLIVFARFLNGLDSIQNWVPAILVVSIAAAAFSHRFIETPFRSRRPAHGRQSAFIGASALASALLLIAVPAVVSKGFPGRYPSEIVEADALRSAEIPYRNCETRLGNTLNELCVLGDESVAPGILLWGDSHMLAWGPGMDLALKEIGRSAYFAPNSACPPILGVDQSTDPLCRMQNKNLIDSLLQEAQQGKLQHVVMSGYWQKYFNDSNLKLSAGGLRSGNREVATRFFHQTIAVLEEAGVSVTVMGPVPDYEKDVPYAVASGDFENVDRQYHDVLAGSEYRALSKAAGFVDLASWFCNPGCIVQDGRAVLYRDSNHLSIRGAERFKDSLKQMLLDNDVVAER